MGTSVQLLIVVIYVLHRVMSVCRATVVERASGELVLGPTPHNHPGQVGAGLAARIVAKTKKEAVTNLFKPASAIANETPYVLTKSTSYPS